MRNYGNTTGYFTLASVLIALGVPAPLAYATASNANAYAKTDDMFDIVNETVIGALYVEISKYVGGKVGKIIEKVLPASNVMSSTAELWAIVLRNIIKGGTGAYTGQAITGEERNVYNKFIRKREVSKEDWTKPLWSEEAFRTTVVGMAFSGIFGTKADLSERNQFQNDYNALEARLKAISKEMHQQLQDGNIEEAAKFAQQGLDEIRLISTREYAGHTISDEASKFLKQTWNDYVIGMAKDFSTSEPQAQQSYSAPSSSNLFDTNINQNVQNNTFVPPPQQPIQTTQTQANVTDTNVVEIQNQPTRTIQGLEDYTEDSIKNIVSDHIEEMVGNDVKIKGIEINGSRARGDAKADSDLDVVVEYEGDVAEDTLFNALNEEPLVIDGIKVDINPITAGKSGTLDEYMKKSQEYDQNKLKENTLAEPKADYEETKQSDYETD